MLSVKKELKIYRGKYEEISALQTEDMSIYLAWDTQEIFVGNKYGVKTPYIGGNRLSEREIRLLFGELTDAALETLRAQILETGILVNTNESDIAALTLRVDTLEGANNDEIVEAVVAILTAEGGALENYYTKTQTDSAISTFAYSKAQVDNKFPDVSPDFKTNYTNLQSRVSDLETADDSFNSVKVLNSGSITESQLLEEIDLADDGVYTFQTENGFEILVINGSNVIRYKPEGRAYSLSAGVWSIVSIDPAIITSINSLTATAGALSIDLDDIPETATKKYNSLLPQSNNEVNPLGRNESYTVGNSSVAFGHNSAAQGVASIALGENAVSTAENAVQIGAGSNSSEDTLKFRDFELVNASGKIPTERIIETFSTATVVIASGDWGLDKEVAKTISGITTSSLIWVSPVEASITAYTRSNVRAVSQNTNSLTFKCDIVPSESVSVNVIWRS